jgi:acetyl esterase/lipase
MKKVLKWILIICSVGLCGLSIYGFILVRRYQSLVSEEPDVVLSPTVPDITYCTTDGIPLKMDLYFPENAKAPYPVLVYFHGGSFTGGDKRQGSGIIDIPAMTERGYAVAAANYRLMPEYSFPAEIIDAKCAIRFLRHYADDYSLDTEKIGVWGGSAGGHLVAMVGLTNADPAFEVGDYLEESSQVSAVVEMFGPSDLTAQFNWLQKQLLRRAFGTDNTDSSLLRQASPVNYVTASAPPFLILHGEHDHVVPVQQAELLYQKLVDAGVDASLVLVENADHNFKPTGSPIDPSRSEISDLMGEFFDRVLMGFETQSN